jgi:hypothetical protein
VQLRLALVLALMSVRGASAGITGLQITTDGCSVADVRAQAVAQIGHDPFDDRARKRITVAIRGTTATLAIDAGQRVIAAANCAELAASIAVVLAMTLSQADEPSPAPIEHDPIGVGFFVTGAADLGGATHVTTGVELSRGRASVSAELDLDLPDDVAGGMIRVVRAQASVSPCFHAHGFGVCLLGRAGVMRGTGIDVLEPRAVSTPTLAAGARVVWQLPLTARFALRLHADLAVNLLDTRLDLDDMPAWTSPRVEGLAGAGLFARFR